jgi:hypothetical protein
MTTTDCAADSRQLDPTSIAIGRAQAQYALDVEFGGA